MVGYNLLSNNNLFSIKRSCFEDDSREFICRVGAPRGDPRGWIVSVRFTMQCKPLENINYQMSGQHLKLEVQGKDWTDHLKPPLHAVPHQHLVPGEHLLPREGPPRPAAPGAGRGDALLASEVVQQGRVQTICQCKRR